MIYWLMGLTIVCAFLFVMVIVEFKMIHELIYGNKAWADDISIRLVKLERRDNNYVTEQKLEKVINHYNGKYESQFNDIYHTLDKKINIYLDLDTIFGKEKKQNG